MPWAQINIGNYRDAFAKIAKLKNHKYQGVYNIFSWPPKHALNVYCTGICRTKWYILQDVYTKMDVNTGDTEIAPKAALPLTILASSWHI